VLYSCSQLNNRCKWRVCLLTRCRTGKLWLAVFLLIRRSDLEGSLCRIQCRGLRKYPLRRQSGRCFHRDKHSQPDIFCIPSTPSHPNNTPAYSHNYISNLRPIPYADTHIPLDTPYTSFRIQPSTSHHYTRRLWHQCSRSRRGRGIPRLRRGGSSSRLLR